MDNYTDIYSDYSWEELTQPTRKQEIQAKPDESDNTQQNYRRKHKFSTPVLALQLCICLFILTLLILLKTFSIGLFTDFRIWYNGEMNSSLYFSGDFTNIDYSQLFSSSKDEVHNTVN